MLRMLILYISGGTYSLKSTANDRYFEKLFMAILFTLRVFARNLLRGNRQHCMNRAFPMSVGLKTNKNMCIEKHTQIKERERQRFFTLNKFEAV